MEVILKNEKIKNFLSNFKKNQWDSVILNLSLLGIEYLRNKFRSKSNWNIDFILKQIDSLMEKDTTNYSESKTENENSISVKKDSSIKASPKIEEDEEKLIKQKIERKNNNSNYDYKRYRKYNEKHHSHLSYQKDKREKQKSLESSEIEKISVRSKNTLISFDKSDCEQKNKEQQINKKNNQTEISECLYGKGLKKIMIKDKGNFLPEPLTEKNKKNYCYKTNINAEIIKSEKNLEKEKSQKENNDNILKTESSIQNRRKKIFEYKKMNKEQIKTEDNTTKENYNSPYKNKKRSEEIIEKVEKTENDNKNGNEQNLLNKKSKYTELIKAYKESKEGIKPYYIKTRYIELYNANNEKEKHDNKIVTQIKKRNEEEKALNLEKTPIKRKAQNYRENKSNLSSGYKKTEESIKYYKKPIAKLIEKKSYKINSKNENKPIHLSRSLENLQRNDKGLRRVNTLICSFEPLYNISFDNSLSMIKKKYKIFNDSVEKDLINNLRNRSQHCRFTYKFKTGNYKFATNCNKISLEM